MKRTMPIIIAAAIIAVGWRTSTAAESQGTGHVDFGTFTPPASGGEFVEVNLSSNIISMAARLVPKKESEIAELLSSLHHVRVNVVGLDDENRDEIAERIQKIRATLAAQGWERLVTAQKQAEDVGVYLKVHGNDAIAGLTVIVMEGMKEAVFVNIVGNIRPEQVALVGERLNIDPLKKIGHRMRKEKVSAKD